MRSFPTSSLTYALPAFARSPGYTEPEIDAKELADDFEKLQKKGEAITDMGTFCPRLILQVDDC